MQKLFCYLRHVDSFGVNFTPAISIYQDFTYKSIQGGLVSLILYMLSLIYFIFEMYRWLNWQMIPVVTTEMHKFGQDIEWLLDESNASIQFEIYNSIRGSESINPFNQSQLILTPILKNYSEGKESNISYNFSEYINGDVFSPLLRLNSKSEYQISFARCVQENLIQGQQCATSEQMNDFFNQGANEFVVNVKLKIIDPASFQVKEVIKTYGIIIEEIECQITKISMIYTNYEIHQGVLFPVAENQIYVSETNEQTMYGTKAFCSKRFEEESFAMLWVSTSPTSYLQRMQYPELGSVLANIGSIIETMFLISYIFTYYNDFCLKQKLKYRILQFYYPELQKIKIERNYFNKIKSVQFENISIDIESFKRFQKQLMQKINCKFSFTNLIYEMSRLQFLIQYMMSREQIMKVHQIGIKIPIEQNETNSKSVRIKNDCLDFLDSGKILNHLNIDDSCLLSLQNQTNFFDDIYVEQELIPDNDFFENNRIKSKIVI